MASVPVRPRSLVGLPLTPLQARWWFLCTSYQGGTSPLVGLVHRFRGQLSIDAWRRSVDALVNRHEILRARFVERPGGPAQVIEAPQGLATEFLDLTDVPVAQREERAWTLLGERRGRTLDLRHDPLVSSTLVRLAPDDHVWAMTIHHILADGESLVVIDADLGALYSALVEGREPDLARLPVGYGDYAVWQAGPDVSDLDCAQESEDRAYWRERLSGVPPLELPTDLPRPARKGAPAAEVAGQLSGDATRRLDELARSVRCTRFMALLAGLNVLLAGYSRQDDFCIGTAVAGSGRALPELADLVGLFSNAIALRADLSGNPTFRELLVRTREWVIDALDHQEVPFGTVVADLGVELAPDRAQVFQVMFFSDDIEVASRLRLPGLVVEDFPLGVPKVLHDIMVHIRPNQHGLGIRFVYDTGLFTAATMVGLVRSYERLLAGAFTDPTVRVDGLVELVLSGPVSS